MWADEAHSYISVRGPSLLSVGSARTHYGRFLDSKHALNLFAARQMQIQPHGIGARDILKAMRKTTGFPLWETREKPLA